MSILEIGNVFIKDVVFGAKTMIEKTKKGLRLVINREEMRRFLLLSEERLEDIDIQIAKPGESTRIVCIKDIIPPRKKIHGGVGWGRTHNMSNVVVSTLGQIISAQEGILDMSGPAAELSPFSKMTNVCVDISVKEGVVEYEHEEAARLTGLNAAMYLGQTLYDVEADEIETFTFDENLVSPELPRVVYMYTVLAQDLLHHNYIGGRDPKEPGFLPFLANPLALLDGFIVSGNCVSACDKTTTWHHWNNAIIRDLFRRYGAEWNFVGVVLSSLLTNMEEKEEMARKAVGLAKRLKPHGAAISKEGFGNPDADIMIIVELLEKAGIKVVSMHNEYAGERGVSNPLADATPYADAIISLGNSNQLYTLPAMERIIGPYENLTILAGAHEDSVNGDGTITVQAQTIYGITHQFGDMTITCEEI